MIANVRPIVTGMVVFIILLTAFFALVTWVRDARPLVAYLSYAVPVLGGCVTGLMARHKPFVALLILGVAASIFEGVLNFVWGWLGLPTDLGGLRQLPLVIGLSLLSIVPLVVIGGAIGSFLQREPHA